MRRAVIHYTSSLEKLNKMLNGEWIVVTIPQYFERFGKKFSVTFDEVTIHIPIDGLPVEIPVDSLPIFNERMKRLLAYKREEEVCL